jgi:hypothetical protein
MFLNYIGNFAKKIICPFRFFNREGFFIDSALIRFDFIISVDFESQNLIFEHSFSVYGSFSCVKVCLGSLLST